MTLRLVYWMDARPIQIYLGFNGKMKSPKSSAFIYSITCRGYEQRRANKVLKLTPAKVKYIIREKTNNISSKIIAAETKVSIQTVNRVWSHWMKNKVPWAPKEFGRPKKSLDEPDIQQILKIHKEQNSGERRIEKIIKQK